MIISAPNNGRVSAATLDLILELSCPSVTNPTVEASITTNSIRRDCQFLKMIRRKRVSINLIRGLFFYQFSSVKFPDHISTTCYIRIVRNHHDRVFGFFMEHIDDIHNSRSIPFVQVSCWLIRKEQRYICNKCSCNSNTLLFSS